MTTSIKVKFWAIVLELNNQNINVERNKIESKSAEKLLKYRKMFKDIFTFLGLYQRDNNVLCCPRNQYSKFKNQTNQIILSHKHLMLKNKKQYI